MMHSCNMLTFKLNVNDSQQEMFCFVNTCMRMLSYMELRTLFNVLKELITRNSCRTCIDNNRQVLQWVSVKEENVLCCTLELINRYNTSVYFSLNNL